MRLSGFNQEGGKVTGSIDNLEITSLQNKSKTTGSSSGVTLGIGSNGVPSSASISGSRTNGSRAYVDNQTTFILGEGSNLTIGKVENTAGIIGVEGNGKLKINEYKGKDLYNHDNLTTTGGSIGVDFGKGGAKVSGIGVNNENHRKEGITRHTVIGNVEIGSATGSPINRDRSKANETTRDDHSSTNVYIEGQTIDYATNPSKLKEDIGKAKDEINDIGRAIKESLNDRGDDNRNFLGQLSEGRLQRTIENIGGERLRKSTTQEDISKTLKDTYKDLGYDIEIIFTTPDKAPQLIDEKGKIKAGTAYVGEDGKHTIKINTEAKENQDRAGLIGTITEEGSHVIGKVEGRQRKVPEGSEEKGLESTGRATNDFFNKTYEEGNIPIQTKSDGKDYSKADFGEHVGDKEYKLLGKMSAEEIIRNSREYILESKKQGLIHSAEALEHFLNNKGTSLKIDEEWYRGYDDVKKAEQRNINRFFSIESGKSEGGEWFSGFKGTPLVALDKINKDYGGFDKMKIGESIEFNDYWKTSVKISEKEDIKKAADFFFTFGATILKTEAKVKVKKIDQENVSIEISNVKYSIEDMYDWHPGKIRMLNKNVKFDEKLIEEKTGLKNVSINFEDSAMKKLVNEKKAKEFKFELEYKGRDRSNNINMKKILKKYMKIGGAWREKWF